MKKQLVAIMLCISTYSFSAPELKGTPDDLKHFLYPDERIISISATAQEKAYSDKATINLIITTEQEKLADAIVENSKLREKITVSLMKNGIKPKHIKSSKFSSSPEYGWFGQKPTSYKVINRMAISIFHSQHMQNIAQLADKNEAIELSNTLFEHTKKAAYQQKIKRQALQDILQQKKFYEKSLNIKLSAVNVVNVKTSHHATNGALLLGNVVMRSKQQESKSSRFSSIAKYAEKPYQSSFDEVIYEATLSVDFKIEK